MPKFRKKPVVIEAVRLLPENYDATMELAARSPDCDVVNIYGDDGQWQVTIGTLEGTMLAGHGDWLILGVKNELYPCKPDIFAATYEAAESDS